MISKLENRSLLSIGGEDAEHFLENLVTCKVTGLERNQAKFGALLTPQGKILFDFFLIKRQADFLIDITSDLAADFLKRMTFYKLRAKVELKPLADLHVAIFESDAPDGAELKIEDPRHSQMPKRAYGAFSDMQTQIDYVAKRIKLGVPEGGYEFQYGDAFPHEVLMDKNQGVDFRKGCYVGQEVVSRMQHKSTIRKRVIKISASVDLPQSGTDILADGKPAGIIGSTNGKEGLALLRLDRAEKAEKVSANDIELTCKRPEWLDIEWPTEV